jgi:hypothetical protein
MKKLIIVSAILLATSAISVQSKASACSSAIASVKLVREAYMGTILLGNNTIYIYGDGINITSASISNAFKTFTVTNLIATKVVNGVAQGRIYATDEDGFQYTFVITGQEVDIPIID